MIRFLKIIKLNIVLFSLLFFASVSFAQLSTPFEPGRGGRTG